MPPLDQNNEAKPIPKAAQADGMDLASLFSSSHPELKAGSVSAREAAKIKDYEAKRDKVKEIGRKLAERTGWELDLWDKSSNLQGEKDQDKEDHKPISKEKQTELKKVNQERKKAEASDKKTESQRLRGLFALRKLRAEDPILADDLAKISLSQDLPALDKLPTAMQERIFSSIETILNGKTQTTSFTPVETHEIVAELVHQIAHPEAIREGGKYTCSQADIEYALTNDHPDVVASKVAEAVTKGEMTETTVLKTVSVPITPQVLHGNDGNWGRSQVSTIMQTGIGQLGVSGEGFQYEDVKPSQAPEINVGKKVGYESGERLMDSTGTLISDWMGLDIEEQPGVLNGLTHGSYRVDTLNANTQDELLKSLQSEAKQYGYPIMVGTDWEDKGGHMIAVIGLDDSTTPRAVIYNDTNAKSSKLQEMSFATFYDMVQTKHEDIFALTPDHSYLYEVSLPPNAPRTKKLVLPVFVNREGSALRDPLTERAKSEGTAP